VTDQPRPGRSSSTDADDTTPRLVAERYQLGPVIGRGGMATVHRATDLQRERAVAVKLLRREVARDRDLAQRFRREALAATVLRHPNVVACLDTGTDAGQPFLVMELIDGEDLAARLRRGGRLAPWQSARIGLDIARALSAAHLRGIVHRDIKPGNILINPDGRAMVTDFGIARLAMDAEAVLPGTTLGSVHYFSPEQARGLATTPASDVYGVGLVLYEMLTGRRAWSGGSSDAIALARVGAPPPSPAALVEGLPVELDVVVRRALAPEAIDRYPDGMALAAALEPIVAALDPSTPTIQEAVPAVTERTVAVAPDGRAPAASSTPPPLVPTAAELADLGGPRGGQARRTGPLIAAAMLAIVGGILGAVLVAALPGGVERLVTGSDPAAISPAPGGPSAGTAVPPTFDPATPAPTAAATPAPTPTATEEPPAVPPGRVSDLCEPIFGLPCGLGPGRYAPSRFGPAFDVTLGTGWSTAVHEPDLVSLGRDEGSMTFASRIAEVDPDGRAIVPRDRARDLIEAMVTIDGVASSRPADVRIGGRRGQSVDLSPIGDHPVALFSTATRTYFLEPDRTSRVVAIDVRGATVVLVIEPGDFADLAGILETADVAAGTIRWR
jgi:tRNA A-37 threonylcarbamoyl transferase component Bud32